MGITQRMQRHDVLSLDTMAVRQNSGWYAVVVASRARECCTQMHWGKQCAVAKICFAVCQTVQAQAVNKQYIHMA